MTILVFAGVSEIVDVDDQQDILLFHVGRYTDFTAPIEHSSVLVVERV